MNVEITVWIVCPVTRLAAHQVCFYIKHYKNKSKMTV